MRGPNHYAPMMFHGTRYVNWWFYVPSTRSPAIPTVFRHARYCAWNIAKKENDYFALYGYIQFRKAKKMAFIVSRLTFDTIAYPTTIADQRLYGPVFDSPSHSRCFGVENKEPPGFPFESIFLRCQIHKRYMRATLPKFILDNHILFGTHPSIFLDELDLNVKPQTSPPTTSSESSEVTQRSNENHGSNQSRSSIDLEPAYYTSPSLAERLDGDEISTIVLEPCTDTKDANPVTSEDTTACNGPTRIDKHPYRYFIDHSDEDI